LIIDETSPLITVISQAVTQKRSQDTQKRIGIES